MVKTALNELISLTAENAVELEVEDGNIELVEAAQKTASAAKHKENLENASFSDLEDDHVLEADITYNIPYSKNASKEIIFSTLTPYSKWSCKISKAMHLSSSDMRNFGYIPS
ncbi:hypothetical protein QCA50_007312 [Cerrena zonata]|uniref:Uncharacterized protein n=1 Tax=Cerrena zonata TaxID=2478898 RepID=A0AAW0G7U2_9APHY